MKNNKLSTKKGKKVSLINQRKTQVKTIMRHHHTLSKDLSNNVGEDIQEKKLQ